MISSAINFETIALDVIYIKLKTNEAYVITTTHVENSVFQTGVHSFFLYRLIIMHNGGKIVCTFGRIGSLFTVVHVE